MKKTVQERSPSLASAVPVVERVELWRTIRSQYSLRSAGLLYIPGYPRSFLPSFLPSWYRQLERTSG